MTTFYGNIWRPDFAESIDGKPLVTRVSEFSLWNFPYERLPTNNGLLAFFMRPEVVVLSLLAYFVSKPPLKAFMKLVAWDTQSSAFLFFIAVHNLGLAIFSGICAWNAWPIVIQHFLSKGFEATYCDQDGSFWSTTGFGSWTTIFYLSKYYEFVDTWILILKGKEGSFLQTYHHIGIVLTMYGGVASQSVWLLFVLLLNSVIHTIMYTYFFVKTISPETEIKAAKYLTMTQIAQFLTGLLGSSGVLMWGEACDTQSSRFSLLIMHIYGWGLVALFVAFAKRKYKKS